MKPIDRMRAAFDLSVAMRLVQEHGGEEEAWDALERDSPLGRFATPEEKRPASYS